MKKKGLTYPYFHLLKWKKKSQLHGYLQLHAYSGA